MKLRPTLLLLLLSALLFSACAKKSTIKSYEEGAEVSANKEPSPADIYVRLGIAYLQENQPVTAMEKIERGIDLDPRNADAYNVKALILERLGEAETAEANYRKAVNLAPRDPYIRNALGSFLCKYKRYGDADQQFNEALKNPLYETPWVALTNAGICAQRKPDLEKAEAYLRRALSLKDDFPVALKQMAQVTYDKGNYLSARAYLQRYTSVAKHTAQTLWLGIQTERELGNYDAAASYELLLRGNFPDAVEIQHLNQSRKP